MAGGEKERARSHQRVAEKCWRLSTVAAQVAVYRNLVHTTLLATVTRSQQERSRPTENAPHLGLALPNVICGIVSENPIGRRVPQPALDGTGCGRLPAGLSLVVFSGGIHERLCQDSADSLPEGTAKHVDLAVAVLPAGCTPAVAGGLWLCSPTPQHRKQPNGQCAGRAAQPGSGAAAATAPLGGSSCGGAGCQHGSARGCGCLHQRSLPH